VLAKTARDLIQSFGYAGPPADRAYGFIFDSDYQNYADRRSKLAEYRDQLARGQPPLIQFWYRQSPQSLASTNVDGIVSRTDPPPISSGMVGLNLDPQGRLIQLDAVPPQREEEQDLTQRAGLAGAVHSRRFGHGSLHASAAAVGFDGRLQ
jgi:hypothetical protein